MAASAPRRRQLAFRRRFGQVCRRFRVEAAGRATHGNHEPRFPRRVRTIATEWIMLADGTRLAATIWLPEDAARRSGAGDPRISALSPPRRHGAARPPDARLFRRPRLCRRCASTCAAPAIPTACSLDEYLPQEQADAVEVIAWLAAQPWCSGAVGMMGISWGGFNALQVASHRPPALKAIITACSTDDRYADDCHYMGGCLLNNTIAWALDHVRLRRAAAGPRGGRRALARHVAASGSRTTR